MYDTEYRRKILRFACYEGIALFLIVYIITVTYAAGGDSLLERLFSGISLLSLLFLYRFFVILKAYKNVGKECENCKPSFFLRLLLLKADNMTYLKFRGFCMAMLLLIVLVSLPFNSVYYEYEVQTDADGKVPVSVHLNTSSMYFPIKGADNTEGFMVTLDKETSFNRINFVEKKSPDEKNILRLRYDGLFIKFFADKVVPEIKNTRNTPYIELNASPENLKAIQNY